MVRTKRPAVQQFVALAERVAWAEVLLKDGRILQGSVVRNPIRQTGTVINAVTDTRTDFFLEEIRSVREVCDPRCVG